MRVCSFAGGDPISPLEAARLLTAMSALQLPEMQWQLPGLTADAQMQFEIGPDGVVPLGPDLLIGNSPSSGWVIRVGAQQLVIRHQQVVIGGLRAPHQFPSEANFSEVVQRALAALPAQMVPRRVGLTVNYACFVGGQFPPSVVSELAGRGNTCPALPPDGAVFTTSLSEVEFETIERHRYVWNDLTRIGNWFSPEGPLLRDAAVVRTLDVKTAAPEAAFPLPIGAPQPVLPPLQMADTARFFATDGPFGLRRVIARLRRTLPEGFALNE